MLAKTKFLIFVQRTADDELGHLTDYTTCVACRVCVAVGRVCPCPIRTLGPSIESPVRKLLIGGTSDGNR